MNGSTESIFTSKNYYVRVRKSGTSVHDTTKENVHEEETTRGLLWPRRLFGTACLRQRFLHQCQGRECIYPAGRQGKTDNLRHRRARRQDQGHDGNSGNLQVARRRHLPGQACRHDLRLGAGATPHHFGEERRPHHGQRRRDHPQDLNLLSREEARENDLPRKVVSF